ncbi:MAG: InlB B-repeat-containing protein [Kiritimatiellae bacterium]|nr:InlB B-repeat-containing protein [Kiritimatiellia bacterium]
MDFTTKTLKRPARIAALGLLSLFLAAPAALAVERISIANPVDLSGRSSAPGSRSPSEAELSAAGEYADFTATPTNSYVFRHWQFLSSVEVYGATTNVNPVRLYYNDSITLLQLRPCFAPTYDVALNPCGGNWKEDATNQVRVVYGDPYGELDSPMREGYGFDGWFTKTSGGEKVTEDTIVTNATEHTLYAQWSGIESTLTFDPRGGAFADPSEGTRTVTYGSPYGKLPDVSNPGYSLDGWFTAASGGEQRTESNTVMTVANHTLYAHWEPIIYAVVFDGNGATSGSTARQGNRVYGEAFTLSPNGFVRYGSKFLGWNTQADGSGSSYTNCAEVINLTTTPNDVVILYAQWSAAVYHVHFEPNDGDGSMDDQTIQWDVDTALASNAFDRAGYAFVSWRDDANNTNHLDGATVRNLFADGTTGELVATWAPVDYTVSFKRGVAVAKGEMDDLPCVYDSPTNLPPCTITNPLGAFLGWALDPKATEPDFLDKAVVTNLATTAGAVVPLYAVWDSELTDLSRAIGCDTLRLESTGDNRWTVHTNDAGEVCLMSGSAVAESTLTTTVNGPGTLTFDWSVSGPAPAEYARTATLKGVDIGGSQSAVASNAVAAAEIATNVWYEKSFSVSAGNDQSIRWYSLKDAQLGSEWAEKSRLFLRNVTWLPDADSNLVYTVCFDANGGSGEMADKTYLSGVAATLPSNAFTFVDCTFDHWHDKDNNRDYPDGATVVDLAPGGGTNTLVAVWAEPPPPPPPVYCTVTFDANGGSVVETSRQVEEGDAVGELPEATRTGYTQEGWWTDPAAGDEISSNTVVSADTTNYAHWVANEYTVAFDPNGGTVSPESMPVTFDSAYGKLPEPVREGDWDFAGWFDAPSGGEQITASTVVTTAADHKLYASWTYTGPIQFSLKVGEYFKATMTELGYEVPTNGTAYSVVANGLPAGLKLKYNAAVKNKKGKVVTKAKSTWWIEGVPTAALDYMTNPAYLVITVNGVAQTFDLPVEVLAQDVVVLDDLALSQSINEQYYLPGVTKGWTVSGLPTGLKYTAKRVTKKSGKKTIVVAEAYSVYGKTTKAGLFTITAKKKKGAFYETMKFRVLVTPAAVDASRFGADLTNITTMAYVPVDWDLVWGGECGGVSLPAVSSVGGKVAKVSGLPGGVKFASANVYADKKKKVVKQAAQTIVGKPTKAGTYVVTFTKNVKSGKKTVAKTAQILWRVVANDAPLSLDFNTAGGVIEGGVVGLKYNDLMEFTVTSNATVTASGLPAGIKLVNLGDGSYAFTGFTTKAGTYLVTVTATLNDKSVSQRVALKVDALPAWAKGTFNGYVAGEDGATNGLATVTVSSVGKLSGKFYDRGTNWTVTAASFTAAARPESAPYQEFIASNVVAKYSYKVKEKVKVKGKWKTKTVTKYATRSFTLTVGNDALGGTATLSENGGDTTVYAWQNLWGSSAYKAVGRMHFYTSSRNPYKVFTIKGTDPAGAAMGLTEAMTLSLKVTPAGAVTATLSYGSAKHTCSTVVIPQTPAAAAEFEGVAYLYFAPSSANKFPGLVAAAKF